MKRPFNRKKLGRAQALMVRAGLENCGGAIPTKLLRTVHSLEDRGLAHCVSGVWRLTPAGEQARAELEKGDAA